MMPETMEERYRMLTSVVEQLRQDKGNLQSEVTRLNQVMANTNYHFQQINATIAEKDNMIKSNLQRYTELNNKNTELNSKIKLLEKQQKDTQNQEISLRHEINRLMDTKKNNEETIVKLEGVKKEYEEYKSVKRMTADEWIAYNNEDGGLTVTELNDQLRKEQMGRQEDKLKHAKEMGEVQAELDKKREHCLSIQNTSLEKIEFLQNELKKQRMMEAEEEEYLQGRIVELENANEELKRIVHNMGPSTRTRSRVKRLGD